MVVVAKSALKTTSSTSLEWPFSPFETENLAVFRVYAEGRFDRCSRVLGRSQKNVLEASAAYQYLLPREVPVAAR